MRQFIIMAGLAFLLTTVTTAQEKPDPAKAANKTTPVMKAPVRNQPIRIKTEPVSQPAPATTPATTPAATSTGPNAKDFHLISASATIYTGNDNKELPSQVQMQLSLGLETPGNYMVPTSKYREFPVNSAVSLPFQFSYDRTYYYEKLSLTNVEKDGIKVYIHYSPNFFLDAWKIEKVVLTLEFRDGKGELHPALNYKNIEFKNIGAVLDENHRTLRCDADRFMLPTQTLVIK